MKPTKLGYTVYPTVRTFGHQERTGAVLATTHAFERERIIFQGNNNCGRDTSLPPSVGIFGKPQAQAMALLRIWDVV